MPEDECDDLIDIIDTACADIEEAEQAFDEACNEALSAQLEFTLHCGLALVAPEEPIGDALCAEAWAELSEAEDKVNEALADLEEANAFLEESENNYWDCINCDHGNGN